MSVFTATANAKNEEEDMYIVLLSGGSGKRLWPLSNDSRSKQYIKCIGFEKTPEKKCSMIQRVWQQLADSDLQKNCIITASAGQIEIIKSQLGEVDIAIEPDRRDTYPAVALSCAYIKSMKGASYDDVVCILPVDPYTDSSYFDSVKQLERALLSTDAEIVLMGAVPQEANSKYGYIIPKCESVDGYIKVREFREKPSVSEAEKLISEGALWNCGIFCFRLGYVLDSLKQYGVTPAYEAVYQNYDRLPKISFDYEILEKARSLTVVPFQGLWKDLGTWETLTKQMNDGKIGNVAMDTYCRNTHVINELDIPIVTMGAENLIVVASFDGVLVADKKKSDNIKEIMKKFTLHPRYEERRWGTLKTLDISENGNYFTLFRKILMFSGMNSSYHYHMERSESCTVLRGEGELILDGVKRSIYQGCTWTVECGQKHGIKSIENLEYMEIHMGTQIGDEDIHRITFNWEEMQSSDCKMASP